MLRRPSSFEHSNRSFEETYSSNSFEGIFIHQSGLEKDFKQLRQSKENPLIHSSKIMGFSSLQRPQHPRIVSTTNIPKTSTRNGMVGASHKEISTSRPIINRFSKTRVEFGDFKPVPSDPSSRNISNVFASKGKQAMLKKRSSFLVEKSKANRSSNFIR